MSTLAKPHVSPALAHLRHGVTGCALAIAACAILQLLVFGFVHFTQVRYAEGRPEPTAQSLAVVVGARPAAALQTAGAKTTQTALPEPTPAPRGLSNWDPALHVFSDAAVVAGVVSSAMLMALVGLGVVVAAGGGIPGIDRAVWSMSWAMLLGLAALPWRDIFPTVPFPGVFSSYDEMTALSDAVNAGQATVFHLLVTYLVMPLAVFAAAMLTLARFRAGIAQGVIVTSVSELDDKIEREMASIRSRGIAAASMPRSVGALNQAIGDTPAPRIIAEASAPVPGPTIHSMKPAAAEPKAGRGWLSRARRMGEPDAGDPLKRPL